MIKLHVYGRTITLKGSRKARTKKKSSQNEVQYRNKYCKRVSYIYTNRIYIYLTVVSHIMLAIG